MKHTIEPERILPLPSDSVSTEGLPTTNGSVDCALNGATSGPIPTEIQGFVLARYCAERSGEESDRQKWRRRFVERGVALSDRTCSLFFDEMEHRRVDAGYAQTNMNIAGTAVTAVLAASGNNARSVFNVATALALGNAWFENYKANYVLTPSLGKLHDSMNKKLRKPLSDAVLASAKEGYDTLEAAVVDVQQYDQLCSHKSIVMYLEKAVENAEVEPFQPAVPTKDAAAAKVILAKLYKQASPTGTETFTDKQAAMLYIIATTDDATSRQSVANAAKKLAPEIEPFLKNLMPKLPEVPVDVLTDFTAVGKLLDFDGNADVRNARLALDQQVAADKSKNGGKLAAAASADQDERKRKEALTKAFEAGTLTKPATTGRINFGYEMVKPSARSGR
jgi:hypothetical protein